MAAAESSITRYGVTVWYPRGGFLTAMAKAPEEWAATVPKKSRRRKWLARHPPEQRDEPGIAPQRREVGILLVRPPLVHALAERLLQRGDRAISLAQPRIGAGEVVPGDASRAAAGRNAELERALVAPGGVGVAIEVQLRPAEL